MEFLSLSNSIGDVFTNSKKGDYTTEQCEIFFKRVCPNAKFNCIKDYAIVDDIIYIKVDISFTLSSPFLNINTTIKHTIHILSEDLKTFDEVINTKTIRNIKDLRKDE
jgi:hypothetical protein